MAEPKQVGLQKEQFLHLSELETVSSTPTLLGAWSLNDSIQSRFPLSFLSMSHHAIALLLSDCVRNFLLPVELSTSTLSFCFFNILLNKLDYAPALLLT